MGEVGDHDLGIGELVRAVASTRNAHAAATRCVRARHVEGCVSDRDSLLRRPASGALPGKGEQRNAVLPFAAERTVARREETRETESLDARARDRERIAGEEGSRLDSRKCVYGVGAELPVARVRVPEHRDVMRGERLAPAGEPRVDPAVVEPGRPQGASNVRRGGIARDVRSLRVRSVDLFEREPARFDVHLVVGQQQRSVDVEENEPGRGVCSGSIRRGCQDAGLSEERAEPAPPPKRHRQAVPSQEAGTTTASTASRRERTYARSASGPSSATSTAREPTTIPSASCAAARAWPGVEIPKPAYSGRSVIARARATSPAKVGATSWIRFSSGRSPAGRSATISDVAPAARASVAKRSQPYASSNAAYVIGTSGVSGTSSRVRARQSRQARVRIPSASARSAARRMTGPSASGSENGKPSSTRSAPPSTAAAANSGVVAPDMR